MRIRRTERIRERESIARELREELLRLIRKEVNRSAALESTKDWQCLLRLVEFSAPGYAVKTRARSAAQIDRRASMLTGPLYTSEAFPIPLDAAGRAMLPICQLELDEASTAIRQPLGDGLLQLWHGTGDASYLIRVVPLLAAYENNPTPFHWIPSSGADGVPLPDGWNIDPCGDAVQEIVELVATGFESQGDAIQACFDGIGSEDFKWLGTLLRLFVEKTPQRLGRESSEVQLFGTFNPIQYSAADIGMPCLMSMNWCASGGAELFYELRKGEETRFGFRSCWR